MQWVNFLYLNRGWNWGYNARGEVVKGTHADDNAHDRAYAYDGTAFASTRDIAWGYNARGELVNADSSITGHDRAYEYDGIGNRKKTADSLTLPGSNNYTVNALNQYTAIGAINPSYDGDGNAIAYPVPAYSSANRTLVWDGENRLVSVTVNSNTTSYLYDAQGRRIVKDLGASQLIRVYDGWNPIAQYEEGASLPSVECRYTWGTDLSGTLQGAGSVGGLLAMRIHGGSAYNFFPTYDGNGNVSEYLKGNGAIDTHFEYDPFGRITVESGTYGIFDICFSSKSLDRETGLYYYGYRYYDPSTGRWPSRDPIEEQGGVNLYGFVGNDGVNRVDYLGLHSPYTDLFDNESEAIEAGGEYALKGATRNLEERMRAWNKRSQYYRNVYPERKPKIFEYCGRVCRTCVREDEVTKFKYYFGSARTDRQSDSCIPNLAPKCLEEDEQVGGYHNHPNPYGLSDNDFKWAKKNGPLGATWYDGNGNPHTEIAPGPIPPIKFPINPRLSP